MDNSDKQRDFLKLFQSSLASLLEVGEESGISRQMFLEWLLCAASELGCAEGKEHEREMHGLLCMAYEAHKVSCTRAACKSPLAERVAEMVRDAVKPSKPN